MSITPYANALFPKTREDNTPIFPNSSLNCDATIASFLSGKDAVRFSMLNHRTYELLTNDPYFKTIFEKYSAVDLGRYLSIYYLKNGWKISCVYIEPNSKPLHFNESLLREPITQFFPAQPVEINRKIEKICGTRYEDPESPIHQVWIAHVNSRNKSEGEWKKMEDATLVLMHAAAKYENLPYYATAFATETFKKMLVIISTDENFKKALMEFDESLGSSDAPEYLRSLIMVYNKQVSKQPLTIEEEQLVGVVNAVQKLEEYNALESERASLEFDLEGAESTLKTLNDPSKIEAASINFEKINRYRLENFFSAYYLNQCLTQIQSVLDHPINGSDPRLQKIQTLINSSSEYAKKRVWQELYYSAGNGVTEDRWSELHFHEHLPVLLGVVKNVQDHLLYETRFVNVFPSLEEVQ